MIAELFSWVFGSLHWPLGRVQFNSISSHCLVTEQCEGFSSHAEGSFQMSHFQTRDEKHWKPIQSSPQWRWQPGWRKMKTFWWSRTLKSKSSDQSLKGLMFHVTLDETWSILHKEHGVGFTAASSKTSKRPQKPNPEQAASPAQRDASNEPAQARGRCCSVSLFLQMMAKPNKLSNLCSL